MTERSKTIKNATNIHKIHRASRNPTSPTPQSTNGSFKKEQLNKVPKLQATWDPNRDQKPPKWNLKTTKMEAQTFQNRAQMGPRGVQKKIPRNVFWGHVGYIFL